MAAIGCEEHGNREVCSRCIYRDFISQNELFSKTLSPSDTGHRFYIPRYHEEKFFSPDFGFRLINEGAATRMNVAFYDTKEKNPKNVGFYKGTANQSPYLTQWSHFAREKNLNAGDVISFYELKTNRGTFRTRSSSYSLFELEVMSRSLLK